MIFVLQLPDQAPPRAWFAFDLADLQRKVLASCDLVDQASDEQAITATVEALLAQGDCRVYWTEAQATAAFEHAADPLWQGPGWRARLALRDQLIAMDVLADDL